MCENWKEYLTEEILLAIDRQKDLGLYSYVDVVKTSDLQNYFKEKSTCNVFYGRVIDVADIISVRTQFGVLTSNEYTFIKRDQFKVDDIGRGTVTGHITRIKDTSPFATTYYEMWEPHVAEKCIFDDEFEGEFECINGFKFKAKGIDTLFNSVKPRGF